MHGVHPSKYIRPGFIEKIVMRGEIELKHITYPEAPDPDWTDPRIASNCKYCRIPMRIIFTHQMSNDRWQHKAMCSECYYKSGALKYPVST